MNIKLWITSKYKAYKFLKAFRRKDKVLYMIPFTIKCNCPFHPNLNINNK